MSEAPGYFGKVATQGDFVTRRLPADFVSGWDDWLQAGMLYSQQQLGERWLAVYLNCPVWRFALAPGVCGAAAMAGVMLPGVDRVGRYFPLTVAAPMASGQPMQAELFKRADGWFSTVEQLALSSLEGGFSLAGLDAALAVLAPQERAPRCADVMQGRALFWTAGAMPPAEVSCVGRALPAPSVFCDMLSAMGQLA